MPKEHKLMEKLLNMEGALKRDKNPYAEGIKTSSPSVNFTFANTHLLPFGYSLALWGIRGSGKTLISHDMVGQLHKNYEDAVAIRFDTEARDAIQLTEKQMKAFHIDKNRLVSFQVNQPSLIFDRIANEFPALIEEGLNIKLIIIDSINQIQGRRSGDNMSIDTVQRGDHAQTVGDGIKMILPMQRKYGIPIVYVSQARAEQDPMIAKYHPYKMAAAAQMQHYCEYIMYAEKIRGQNGNKDLLDNEFVNEDLKDIKGQKGEAESTGHKIRVTMQRSSVGTERVGEVTYDYHNGFINLHEEVFLLGVNRGIIQKPTNMSYVYKDRKWTGKPGVLEAIKNDPELSESILKDVRSLDIIDG